MAGAPEGFVQIGHRNYQHFFNQYFTTERTLQISDKDGTTIINVSLSWIHEAPGDRMVYADSVRIRIRVVDDDRAENLILREYRDNPEHFHYLTKEGCGSFMYLVTVQRGSVVFEIKTDNFETISSLKTALQKGTIKVFLEKLFMHGTVYGVIREKTVEVSLQFIIPDKLMEVEEYVGVAKAAVKEIIKLDKMERLQKARTCTSIREVADVIERAEQEENRRRRNVLAATAVITSCTAALSVFTFGASLAVGALSTGAIGAVALTIGAVVLIVLARNPIQVSAEKSRKEYVDVVSKYRKALLKVLELKQTDNQEVVKLLQEIEEVDRRRLLQKYLKDPTMVKVKERVDIQIGQETLGFEYNVLLDLLRKIFNLGANNVQRTREMATQVENFQLIEAQ